MSSFIASSGRSARGQDDKNGEMEALLTTIDSAFNPRLDSVKGYEDCFTKESGVTKLLLLQQADPCGSRNELGACGARPKVGMPPLTPCGIENVWCCWSLERRRQATYRVLFERPLLLSTPAAKTSGSPRIVASLAQQVTEETKPRRTPRPRKRRSPKVRWSTATSSKRRCTAAQRVNDSQVPAKSEIHTVKVEEKLSLIDQILFSDQEDLVTTAAETAFTKAEWRVLDSGLKNKDEEDSDRSVLFAPQTSSSISSNGNLSLVSVELLLAQSESDKSDQIDCHAWSSTGPDFLNSLDEMKEEGEDKETPVESPSPLDSCLLDDLLGTSGCDEPSLDFEL